MDSADLETIIGLLREQGVQLEVGLSDEEVAQVESTYRFRFPPDLRALLQTVLPVSDTPTWGFPDWRSGNETALREQLRWPLESMCFDIEHNAFWLDEWGPKPEKLEDAFQIARRAVAEAPVLVPIYEHRYIPDEPHLPGNPVFSVWQTDIIFYGVDLAHYFITEFSRDKPPSYRPPWGIRIATDVRPIRFWTQLTLL